MFIRVTRGSYPAGAEDRIRQVTEEQMLPKLRELPGFRGYYGGFDAGSKRLVGISLWETREQAERISGLRGLFDETGIQFEAPEMYEIAATA